MPPLLSNASTDSCSATGQPSMCNSSIVSWLYLVLQLCWLRWRHRDGCSNEPSLAPNLSHISRANTGSLLAATLHSLLTSCSDAPPPGCLPQSTGPTNVYSGHCHVFIHCVSDCIFLFVLEAMGVYTLVYSLYLCVTVKLTYHTSTVTLIMFSFTPFGSLSLCFLASGQESVSYFRCYKPPLPQPPKTLSSLHLFIAPLRPQMHSGHFLCGLFWQQLSEPSQPFNGWVLPGSPVLFLLLPESGTLDTHSCSSSACIIDAVKVAIYLML